MVLRTILLSLFLSSSFILSAQQVNWLQSYLSQQTIGSRDFMIENDGTIVAGGYFFDDANQQARTTHILSIDSENGDSLTFQQCESGVFCDNRNDILLLTKNATGAIFTAGNLDLGSGDYLAKINGADDLNMEWLRNDLYATNLIHHVEALETVSDGIIIAGTFSEADYLVVKYDFEGNKLWSRKITVSEIGRSPLITITTDGNVVMIYTDGLNNGLDYLSRIDGDGNLLWTVPITDTRPLVIAASPDNQVFTLNVVEDSYTGNELYSLVKYDMNGTPTVFNSDCDINFPLQMHVNQTSEIFVSSSVRDDNGDYGFGLAKFSPSGTLLFYEGYKEEGFEDAFFDMELLGEQTIIMMGRRRADNAFKRSIVLISIDGNTGSTSTSDLTDSKHLQIAPNPVRDQLNLSFSPANHASIHSFELFNIQGQVIKSEVVNQLQKLNINVVDLQSGIYFISIKDQDGSFYSKKFNKL